VEVYGVHGKVCPLVPQGLDDILQEVAEDTLSEWEIIVLPTGDLDDGLSVR
jgi:hypothetical protein